MPTYDNNLTGALFKNDRRETESHPHYKGSCEIEGKEYWVAGWIKEGKKGTFMSLAFTEKDAAPAKKPAAKKPIDPDADLPF